MSTQMPSHSGNEDIDGSVPRTQPRHIAIIMDGNGRWATQRHLPRVAGHKSGVETVRNIVESCAKYNIEALTLFAFSSENWRRPDKEVSLLMELFMTALKREVKKLHENNVKLEFIGDRSAFSERLQQSIREAEEHTIDNDGLKLNIAANYGGRWDIANAAKALAKAVQQQAIDINEITPESFCQYLSLAALPEPDLFIRTGGEQRISNFLVWQLAYTELYFTDVLWPDFTQDELLKAMDWFSTRQRRFGRTGEQLAQECKGA